MDERFAEDRSLPGEKLMQAHGSQQPQVDSYPVCPERLPEPLTRTGKYSVRFARSRAELDEVLRLRFEVFNVELGEGLDESWDTGRDLDEFDEVCHHLMVVDEDTGCLVGTYRMQTAEMAARHRGFYTADEFDLARLPREMTDRAIEVGRASVARDYRNRSMLFLLWRGLASYMTANDKRYLFGCCSLTSQDPAEGKRVMDDLIRHDQVHPRCQVRPRPDWTCYPEEFDPGPAAAAVEIPRLFRTYLRFGGKVCGPPAIDRRFKTIDYLVLLDIEELDAATRRMFFG